MEFIKIGGAKENNLKNIDVDIPLNKITCITGVSGCGKSSLVFNTIYAESQRNFVEGMIGVLYGQKIMEKPNVDSIINLKPALNLSQKYYNSNPRSTVGTVTDLSHYLRALFALICGEEERTFYSSNYFSFNNISSACPECSGLGTKYKLSFEKLIPDKSIKLSEGAIKYFSGNENSYQYKMLVALCEKFGIDINKRFCDLSPDELEHILYRKDKVELKFKYRLNKKNRSGGCYERGLIVELTEKTKQISESSSSFKSLNQYLINDTCECCHGYKLNEDVLAKKICSFNISEVEEMELNDLLLWTDSVLEFYSNTPYYLQVDTICKQINSRIRNMLSLKLGYLSLQRSVPTLSDGELQRIRLSNQLNCSLNGLIYILDEPCKGLHHRDIQCIIDTIKKIVANGNTVIAIEHNKNFLISADNVIELGPAGGADGGYLMDSISTDCIKKRNNHSVIFSGFVELLGVNYRIIQNQHFRFPINSITCITGVSGSGKSTLAEVLENSFNTTTHMYCRDIKNNCIEKAIRMDQSPIGKTARSTVVSYLGIFDEIRNIYANLYEAKKQRVIAADFSMNIPGGRCETCLGTGVKKIELSYLPETYIKCPDCCGKRFKQNILSVKYKGLSIFELLNIPIKESIHYFENNKRIFETLNCVIDIGLGYLTLGQMSMNLSGGEAKRIKLAKALSTSEKKHTLFILDEPTAGLNSKDISKLQSVLDKIISDGATVILIEHNVDFICSTADYIVDLGIKPGKYCSGIASEGLPENVLSDSKSSLYGIY